MEAALYDKKRRPIHVGDVLKVYHYTAAVRRKRCYMYKQALAVDHGFRTRAPYMRFGHLDFNDSDYPEIMDGRVLADYEIVQSIDAKFEDRPRLTVEST
jgi:hypothetical protein